jgi:uncharacterized protein
MIVELSSIGKTPKTIEKSFAPDEIDLSGEAISLDGPAVFSGEAFESAGRAHVRGQITADVTLNCTRCLEPVERHLDITFDDSFVDASEETTDAETEITEEALDESLVDNGVIDIADVVREQLLLALPEQVLCGEDCRGLCPKCGENLNLIDCKCADDDIDPRWAALKGLKGQG